MHITMNHIATAATAATGAVLFFFPVQRGPKRQSLELPCANLNNNLLALSGTITAFVQPGIKNGHWST